MSDIIKPTVGRVVHFYTAIGKGPFAAIVTGVDSSGRYVHATVFFPGEESNPLSSVTLVQPGEDPPEKERYCTWMPYQVKRSTGSESGEKAAGSEEDESDDE